MFRRLRDDILEGKILEVGMIRGGGFELQKCSVEVLFDQWEFHGATKVTGKLALERGGKKSGNGKRKEFWTITGGSKRKIAKTSTQQKTFCN